MRILFLTQRLPYAPNRGDRIRAYHMIRLLSKHATVSVVSLVHDGHEESHATDVYTIAHDIRTARIPTFSKYARAALALGGRAPLTFQLLHAPTMSTLLAEHVRQTPPDVVFAYCSSMARYAMEPPLQDVPFVFDIVDVDSAKWRDMAQTARWPLRLIYAREAACLAPFEAAAVRAAGITLAVNDKEANALGMLAPHANIQVVPNGIDLNAFASPQPPSEKPHVVFCGVLDYGPNEDAALRLARDIWPLVHRREPTARLFLVGANPTAAVRRVATSDGSITVTGSVPDVRPYLWDASVAVVPLRVARGLQNKVLEALAAGLPTVVSQVVADGLPANALQGCAVAETSEEFAETILAWLSWHGCRRRALAATANLESLTWERQLHALPDIVAQTARRSRERPG